MPKTKEEIDDLLANHRFDSSILPTLEEYVTQQANEGCYHLEANLQTLKLYKFHPEKINYQILSTILFKCLSNLPSSDMKLALHLIPQEIQEKEPINKVIELGDLLESAHFKKFWTKANEYKEHWGNIKDFTESIRTFILGLLKISFLHISKEYLKEVTNLNDDELANMIQSNEWESTDELVKFPESEYNQPKPKEIQQNMKFEQLSKFLSTLDR
eukprot:TRINITY_DN16655_c0_g1_i1.p1 TRINITY_DN16655_c0_g1~~TRINITY_DN16655_c0_g1_i1.p1  ORF type:complete len:215 (-),score=65.19 TRINITY_DN16655_c0_g1_i1:130-774(-)